MISKFFFTLSNLAVFGLLASAITRVTLSLYSWFELTRSLGYSVDYSLEAIEYVLSGKGNILLNGLHATWLAFHPTLMHIMGYSAELMPFFIALFIFGAFAGILAKLLDWNWNYIYNRPENTTTTTTF